MNAVEIGFATTGATLFVSIALFAISWIRGRIVARHEARRLLLTRVLDTFENAYRGLLRAPWARLWSPAEAEYAILLPRLLLELPKRDRVIASWVARQVQLMQSQPSDQKAFTAAGSVAAQLVGWYHGEVKRQWFRNELAKDPYDPAFKVPAKAKRNRQLRGAWRWSKLTIGAVLIASGFRYALRAVWAHR